jgi:hypothetical protein
MPPSHPRGRLFFVRGGTLCGVLQVLFAALPLGTALLEIATAITLAVAVFRPARGGWPYLAPIALVTCCSLVATMPTDLASLRLAVGPLWALALCLAIPRLTVSPKALQLGVLAAAVVAATAIVQGAIQASQGEPTVAKGTFSHHLTLGYALVPPLAILMHHELGLGPWWRRAAVVLLAGGIVASGGQGPLLAMVLVLLAHWMSPVAALVTGVVANLIGVIVLPSHLVEQRAVLWTSGADVLALPGVGVGQSEFRTALAIAEQSVQPGFYFPLHAHDSFLQVGLAIGLGAWIALAALLVLMWERTGRAGRVAIAAVVVGGLTQDTLGDLEVIRALTAWVIGTSVLGSVSEPQSEGST